MTTAEILRKVRGIEIVTRRLADEKLAGQYHSVFRGRGMAFSEVRPYQPGDDVRAIDWNVSARMNEPYVKLFIEEHEMTVLLLVDMSASGAFGTRASTKRDLAAEIAAVIAFSAIRNQDRVGLVAFTDRVERFVPPKRGRGHVLRVVREILGCEPAGRQTRLRAALEFCGRVARRRTVVFVVSDFLDDLRDYGHALRVVSRKHDVVPIVLTDDVEERLPAVGLIELEDLETGARVLVDTRGPMREAYARRVAQARVARETLCRRLSIEAIDVRPGRPYLPALVAFFRARERRLRH